MLRWKATCTRVGALLLCAGTAWSSGLPELPPDLGGGMPEVLTPARLQQAQIDVAASVTVIDREMIRALGVRDIPELLRLVPGMMVTNESEAGHTFAVNYHGTNLSDIRRLQVLVDGVSMYQPAFARVMWSELPVAIHDIERIEVTRGPNAATYGSNSFSGIINIITIHPQETGGQMLRVSAGNRDTLDSSGHVSGHGENSDWRLSFSTKQDSGFDFGRGRKPVVDDRRVATTGWRSEYRPGENDRLEFMLGFAGSKKEVEAEDYGVLTHYERDPVVTTSNGNFMARWTHDVSARHSVQLQAYTQYTSMRQPFRACLMHPVLLSDELAALAARDPDYAIGLLEAAGNPAPYIAALPLDVQPLAQAAVLRYMALPNTQPCGDVLFDTREARADIELQDTLRINDDLRIVSGIGVRYDYGTSDSYLDGSADNSVVRAFGHGEYRLADPLLFNFGAMLEYDEIGGSTFSPMGGLNWRFLPQQSLRLVGSRAWRTQDIYEEYAKTRITFRNLSPLWSDGVNPQTWSQRDLFLIQEAPGNLKPERIDSLELGYFGYFPSARLETDVRWFRERLDSLISKAINPASFDADNDTWIDLDGVEWQARWRFGARSWLWASYAYIDHQDNSNIEGQLVALHSGSLAIAHRFSPRWSGSAAWYFSRKQNETPSFFGLVEYGLDRLDLRLTHELTMGETRLLLSANAQCRFDDDPHIHRDNLYADRVYAYFGLQLDF